MRVLYLLTDGFGSGGGVACYNRDFLRALASFGGGCEVLALPRAIAGETGELPAGLTYDEAAARGKLAYLLRMVCALLSGRRYDFILCGHLNLQPLARIARRVGRARSILLLHGIEAWTPPASSQRRRASRGADWVAAVSRVTLDRFMSWSDFPRERVSLLPCAVDLRRFTPGEPSPSVLEKYRLGERTVVLTLGRLSSAERYKGFDELLDALPLLRSRRPELLCVIAGDGDDRRRLEAKARDLGIFDFVRFTGYVPEAELVHLYRAARAFTLAGHGEGFGIVLLEAMACGIPVVASTLDGSFEAIGGGKLGIAVDPTDQRALIEGISAALSRPVGVRPVGLDGFSYEAFETRVHGFLARIAASPGLQSGWSEAGGSRNQPYGGKQ